MNKVLAGEAGKEKAREWGRWLATDEGQAYLAAQMDADFFEERENMDDGVCEESRKRVFCNLQKKISRRRFAGLTLKVVAVVVPVAAVIAILLYLNTQVSLFEPPFYQDIHVAKGERMQIAFQDGTRVYLYPGSRLCYPDKFGLTERRVTLDGEAYLEVAKDEDKPFVLHTSRGDVRVLGTKFNVFNYSDKPLFETTLLQGAVEVDCGAKGGKLHLSPNEQVVLNDGKMLKRTVKEDEFLLWNEGLLYFDNQLLSYIILRLESYYDVKFVVQNRNCLKGRFTAKFRVGDDIKVILDALINTGRFSYKLSVDNKIVYIQ